MGDNFYQDNLDPDEQNWKKIIENSYQTIEHFKKGKYAEYCRQVEIGIRMSQFAKAKKSVSAFTSPGFRSNEESSGLNDSSFKKLLMLQLKLLTKVSHVNDEDNEQDDEVVPDYRSGDSEIPVTHRVGLVDPEHLHDIKKVLWHYESDDAKGRIVRQDVNLNQTAIFSLDNTSSSWSSKSDDGSDIVNTNRDQQGTIVDSSSLFGIDSEDLQFAQNEDVPKSSATTRVDTFCVGETHSKRKQNDSTAMSSLVHKKKRIEQTNNPHCSKIINCVNDDDLIMHDEAEELPNHPLPRKQCIEKATNTDFSHLADHYGQGRELWLQNGKLQGQLMLREEEIETTRKELYDSRLQIDIMSGEVDKAMTLVYKAYEDNWKWQMELEPKSMKDQGCQCSLLETNPNNPDVILPGSMPEVSPEYQDVGYQSIPLEMNQDTEDQAIRSGGAANDSQVRNGNIHLQEDDVIKFVEATIEEVRKLWNDFEKKPSDALIDTKVFQNLGEGFPLPKEKFRNTRNNYFKWKFGKIGHRRETKATHLSSLREILQALLQSKKQKQDEKLNESHTIVP